MHLSCHDELVGHVVIMLLIVLISHLLWSLIMVATLYSSDSEILQYFIVQYKLCVG